MVEIFISLVCGIIGGFIGGFIGAWIRNGLKYKTWSLVEMFRDIRFMAGL
jgi:hypothetical protein